jgi:hypothetical protein
MNINEDTLRRIMRAEINSLEVRLDAKLKAQDRRIDARFDAFELNLAKFFGQTHRYFDKRFNTFEQKFDKKFNGLQNSVDGIVKRLDTDDVERAAMNSQLARHDTWIDELAQNTSTVLSAP